MAAAVQDSVKMWALAFSSRWLCRLNRLLAGGLGLGEDGGELRFHPVAAATGPHQPHPGQSSVGQAQAVIDYHLDRLFPASRPALRRAPVTFGGQEER